MNRNPWISLQSRLGCAAAATLASGLVLGSVLWLFLGAAPGTASAAPHQVLASQDHPVVGDRTRVR
jgi:hypothetical protein